MLHFHRMRLIVFILTASASILVVAHFAVDLSARSNPLTPGEVRGDIERGAYLIRLAGCVSCHTDVENDGIPLTGGRRIVSAFGTFVSPNITPDEETGIGGWSDEQFLNALTRGLSPDGDHYYPAFPYTSYTQMTVQDVIDLKAYLDSVDPVSQEVSMHDLSFPFNVRGLLSWWKLLFFDAGEYVVDNQQTEAWNRGAYIVHGTGHCGECHSPRKFLGGIGGPTLSGNSNGPDDETVPPLKGKRALDGWTLEDVVFALELGVKPDGDSFSGSMGEVVDDSTAYYSEKDRAVVAEYLLSKEP